jgi:ribosomal protein L7/L12
MNISSSVSVVLVAVVVVVVIVLFGSGAATRKKVEALRARGIYPEEGAASEADVLRLLKCGEKIMAIRCYREIHKVGLKEAKEAVEQLETENA